MLGERCELRVAQEVFFRMLNIGSGYEALIRNFVSIEYRSLPMENSVQALVCSRLHGPYEVETLILGHHRDDEVVVRMVATGICHTDYACTNVRKAYAISINDASFPSAKDKPNVQAR